MICKGEVTYWWMCLTLCCKERKKFTFLNAYGLPGTTVNTFLHSNTLNPELFSQFGMQKLRPQFVHTVRLVWSMEVSAKRMNKSIRCSFCVIKSVRQIDMKLFNPKVCGNDGWEEILLWTVSSQNVARKKSGMFCTERPFPFPGYQTHIRVLQLRIRSSGFCFTKDKRTKFNNGWDQTLWDLLFLYLFPK